MKTAIRHLVIDTLASAELTSTDRLQTVQTALGLRVKFAEIVVEGLLREVGDGYEATLPNSTKRSTNKWRFALAHEAAHLILFKTTGLADAFGHRSSDVGRDEAEIETLCNQIATEILMPSEDWMFYMSKHGVSQRVLGELAKRYQVSLTAAIGQATTVSPWRCSAIMWTDLGHSLRCLRYWPGRSGRQPTGPDDLDKTLASSGSPTQALLANESVVGDVCLSFQGQTVEVTGESWPVRHAKIAAVTLIVSEPYPERILRMHDAIPHHSAKGRTLF